MLTAISFVGITGVAMSPGNLALTRRIRFSLLTLAPWPVASLLFAVVTARDNRFRWGGASRVACAYLRLCWVAVSAVAGAVHLHRHWTDNGSDSSKDRRVDRARSFCISNL